MTDSARPGLIGSQSGSGAASDAVEATNLKLKVLALSAENERLRNTVSFQLGAAILRLRSLEGLLHFPADILRIVQLSRHRRGLLRAGDQTPLNMEEKLRRIVARALDMSVEDIEGTIKEEGSSPAIQSTLLTGLGNVIRPLDARKGLELARRAAAIYPVARTRIALANLLVDAGAIDEPLALYRKLQASRTPVPFRSKQRQSLLEGMVRVRRLGLDIGPRIVRPALPRRRSILYVAASSFPYHTSGYTSRTQALLRSLVQHGEIVEAVTRPGYPLDRNDVQEMPAEPVHSLEGVTYTRLAGPKSNATPFDEYCAAASLTLGSVISRTKPTIVHAASNYVNAAPALLAARRAGLPFVYEVRGLWELTHASRVANFEGSERFEWQRLQETVVAREADLVVTISDGLKQELVARGVDETKVIIVPNCVDSTLFIPRRTDRRLKADLLIGDSKVIGFIGSITAYEGLVDLVTALAQLRSDGMDVCALVVGDGPEAQAVREAARSLGVQRHLIMPGRVPHADVAKWYSLMDVAAYPRRPSRLTEMVPPLKPLEAMAMGIPVVASNVSAICESITDGETGFLFDRGRPDQLALRLKDVLTNPREVRAVVKRARRHVQDHYSWASAAGELSAAYSARLEKAASA